VQSHAGSSTLHQQACDHGGFHNHVTLIYEIVTMGSAISKGGAAVAVPSL